MLPDVLRSGSRPPSFFSSTIDSRAAVRASAWCSSQSFLSYGIDAHGTRAGGSNIPRRMRARNSRLTQTSMSASASSPCATADGMCSYVQPQFRSQPALTAIAADSSHVCVTLWFSWKSLIAQQSLTTKPPKPHSPRRILPSSVGLPEHGSPLVRLYAAMMLSAFASMMQASNAGR